MRFLTFPEAADWCRLHKHELHPNQSPVRLVGPAVHFAFPSPDHRLTWFSKWLTVTTPAIGERLLWTTGWGIWPSSENWTLFHRLRSGFGESRGIEEAPAVVAGPDEVEELAAFVHIALLFGWDAHLLSAKGMTRTFISHDEWVSISSTDEGLLKAVTEELKAANVRLLPGRAA